MENSLELRTVNELRMYSFYIPAYQRGYRWTMNEVKDLLDDINEFKPRQVDSSDEKTWYCLQPIVLKEISPNKYEVIDGQQRLTTIYLILHYLNLDYVPSSRDKLFDIEYETRKDSGYFLKNLGDYIQKIEQYKDQNIDYYHIVQAYLTITKWFSDESNKNFNFDKSNFRSKLKFNSKVIWYQSFEDDTIAMFTRINMGKIPLTNSELIKALFLNSSNFDSDDKRRKQRQFEIASEWDDIELTLQDDKFWYFICKEHKTTNRIEFIFNLMNIDLDNNDKYSTFRFFNKRFQNKTLKTIEDNWSEVKRYFQRFKEWYNERELYHKIGYLLYIEQKTIKELYDISSYKSKSEFGIFLNCEIKDSLKDVKLEDIQYGDKKVKAILLLYNILTMLKCEKDNSYFPFDIFKNEKWDIEHITSVKDAMPDNNRQGWLKDALNYLDIAKEDASSIKAQAEICNCDNDDEFKLLFERIVNHFNSEIGDNDINDISNLTLLDSETNRGYKNAVFPMKRKTIIDRDKSGIFIPLCTKNVFLKYFSDYPPKISFWTEDDREKYNEDLNAVLSQYLNE